MAALATEVAEYPENVDLLPRRARIAERSNKNDKEHRIQHNIQENQPGNRKKQ